MKPAPPGTLVESVDGERVHATGRVFLFAPGELDDRTCACGAPFERRGPVYTGTGDLAEFACCPVCALIDDGRPCFLVPRAMGRFYGQGRDVQ